MMTKQSIYFWQQWLKAFEISESPNSVLEDEYSLARLEKEKGFKLPEEYKGFCQVFGTCSFYGTPRVYCPNSLFSEISLQPLREEFEYLNDASHFDVDSRKDIERVIFGSGLVFADDRAANIYIFDLSSYITDDKSCDIWKASGEGDINDFLFCGRSFYSFFLDTCLEVNEGQTLEETIDSLPDEKKPLRRFDMNQHLNLSS